MRQNISTLSSMFPLLEHIPHKLPITLNLHKDLPPSASVAQLGVIKTCGVFRQKTMHFPIASTQATDILCQLTCRKRTVHKLNVVCLESE